MLFVLDPAAYAYVGGCQHVEKMVSFFQVLVVNQLQDRDVGESRYICTTVSDIYNSFKRRIHISTLYL